MSKVYLVIGLTDVDGGFGDAVETERIMQAFDNRADAIDFMKAHWNPHVYCQPYNALVDGQCYIREVPVSSGHATEELPHVGYFEKKAMMAQSCAECGVDPSYIAPYEEEYDEWDDDDGFDAEDE